MAIKIAQLKPQPDLILLDIMMPGIDGFETCKQLKLNMLSRSIPVIFVTAKISAKEETKGLALGAVDYITKPFNSAVVCQRIRTHLALHNQKNELYRQVKKQTHELISTRYNIIQKFGSLADYKDSDYQIGNFTSAHIQSVSMYAYILAKACGMDEFTADILMNAAPMHDIGKIGIPDYILKKNGALSEEERSIMQDHAILGGEILDEDNPSYLMAMAKTIAITHHEKWDGSGYPYGLQGEEIPLEGRIIAIVDVFDALLQKDLIKNLGR